MLSSLSEQLTKQFYDWEILGRGWIYADDPIELEPPFTPFFGHFPWQGMSNNRYHDDGLRHTLVSRLIAYFSKKQPALPKPEHVQLISHDPYLSTYGEDRLLWQLVVPKDALLERMRVERWLSMLSYCTQPVSFEFVGNRERIIIQITCGKSDEAYIKAQCSTYFSPLSLIEAPDAINWQAKNIGVATVDYGLKEEFTRPLLSDKDSDPLAGIFTLLEHLRENETVLFQVLFNGLVNNWRPSAMKAVSGNDGSSFFLDAPEMPKLAELKTGKPLLAASLRCFTMAPVVSQAFQLLNQVTFALEKAFLPFSNTLIALPGADYTLEQRICDIALRMSHRLGMLLNTEELAHLIHIPKPPHSAKLLGRYRKTKLPSAIAVGNKFSIGISQSGGERREVTINSKERLKHTHIIGATGTGKSTLLTSMICQDIVIGNGVAVLDPHGDLIETILSSIPANRVHDVVIVDPSDSEFPIGFNILHAHSEIEKETLSSDLVSAFKRLSTSWGDQMHSVLSNALLAFLGSTTGGTLFDLRRFLLETAFRTAFLETVDDYSIQYYWQKQYPLLKATSIGPILTRLDNFLRPKVIRNMVAQKKGLDFGDILDKQKILLIKLSQGLIGEENSYLLGSFIVSKIHQAALARQAIKERRDFFFYIDEFQHFITPSMAGILSGARKYHLGLVLAHQDLQQLSRTDSDISSSLLSNAGTRICFRVGEADAKKLSEGFSFFDAADLQNLNTGEAVGRIEKPENDFSFETMPFQAPDIALGSVEHIVAYSRERYATPKDYVEHEFRKTMTPDAKSTSLEKKDFHIHKSNEERPNVEPIQPPESNENKSSIPDPLSTEEKAELTKHLIHQKEESQHRYLQNLIKRLSESKGFKATIEAPMQSNDGRVDVLLERDNTTIACEISVTTDITWELHNIKKCLIAGYTQVISCVTDKKTKTKFSEHISQAFTSNEQERISVFEIEELLAYLDQETNVKEHEVQTVKGYRVKVQYDGATLNEQLQKKQAVTKVIANALKRMKS